MFFNTVTPNRISGAHPPPRIHSHPAASRPATVTADETPPEPPHPPPRQADLLYFTDIESRLVEWLWHHRLAAGSLAVLFGDPGSCKPWLALAIAAALSQGQSPGAFDSTGEAVLPPCTILCAATHHQGSELLRPRFLSLGGDPARLALLRGVAAPGALGLPKTLPDNAQHATRHAHSRRRPRRRLHDTIRGAKQDIGVVSTKNTFDGAWYWELPQNPAPDAPPGAGKEKLITFDKTPITKELV